MTPRPPPSDELADTRDDLDSPPPSGDRLRHGLEYARTQPLPDAAPLHLPAGTGPIDGDRMPRPPTWHVTPTDIADSEWGQRVTASIDRYELRWKWTKRGLVTLGPVALTALTIGLGWLRADGDKAATMREREAQRIEVRAAVTDLRERVVPELRAMGAQNFARIEALRGALDMINRLGAVRVQGPPPEPLLPVPP